MPRPVPILLLVAAHVVFIVGSQTAALFPARGPYEPGHFVGFALVLSQTGLAATFALLAPLRRRSRWLVSLAICLAVWAAFTLCLAIGSLEGRERWPVTLSAVAVVVLLSYGIALLVMRVVQVITGWRFVYVSSSGKPFANAADGGNVRQFGIAEMIAATAVVALLSWCAVAAESRTSSELNLRYLGCFALVIFWESFHLPLGIWTVWADPSKSLQRIGIYLGVWWFVFIFAVLLGDWLFAMPEHVFLAADVTYSLVLLASLFVLRWAGYRFPSP